MKLYLTLILVFSSMLIRAQGPYAPPAGQPSSTAISADDNRIIGWATSVVIERGYLDISNPSLGYASVGNENSGVGKPFENGVVSLGDAGTATLTFSKPIQNNPGPDFAVFENGFNDYFLELAFVEVSSNGMDFYRFPAVSLTDTNVQITYDTIHASNLYNLAGKYRAGFGTPFDLEELKDIQGLDIGNITHVRLLDVVGSVNPSYAGLDSAGRPVNDPWPTAFPSGGFDLDAVGVIGQLTGVYGTSKVETSLDIYPMPASTFLNLKSSASPIKQVELFDYSGKLHQRISFGEPVSDTKLSLELPCGVYILQVMTFKGVESHKVIVQ